MRNLKNLLLLIGVIVFASCSQYQRIGDLTIISNRNINTNENYVLIKRGVEAKAKMKNDDALENAIDNLADAYNGEYIMNAKIYVKDNGKKIKVVGDVWGSNEQKEEYMNKEK